MNGGTLADILGQRAPVLALAPMQDVTDLPFWRLISTYGGADLYFTEYFRVTAHSRPERHIARSLTENPTGRPAVAQMIGNDIPSLVRTARELMRYPVAGIDLNLGCPAPVVYRKCAGGGLLRDPARIDAILGALRQTISIPFTVKTRVGFADVGEFAALLKIFARHELDLLTVHGRTVTGGYRSEVRYDLIARAAELPFPVIANGDIPSAEKAVTVLSRTGARGLMIGRGAIRNPWLFDQIRDRLAGRRSPERSGREVLGYIRALYEATRPTDATPQQQVQKMKKYLNFIGDGVDPEGRFLHGIRRVENEGDFFRICEEFLSHDGPMFLGSGLSVPLSPCGPPGSPA